MLGLKIPIAALLYLVHWAIKQSADPEPAGDGDGGVKPRHPPRLPRHPRRRGPHGAPGVASPGPRTRVPVVAAIGATARGPHART
jgi:hypothetical protein